MRTRMPDSATLHEAGNEPVLGNYVVVIDGRPTAYFASAEQATVYLVRTPGRARIYGPEGHILVTRGRIVRD